MRKFIISNERVATIENRCCISCLKNRLGTFITLQESLMKPVPNGQQAQPQPKVQPQVMNSSLSVNSSIGPLYGYPAYYSGIQASMVAQPVIAPKPQVVLPPANVNINLAGEPSSQRSFVQQVENQA